MNSSFENQWRNALRNAEENPPIDVWRKIEGVLDNEFLIELAVKNKLLSGSEVPDASVWDNIEKALDQERKPIFILWFNKYAAAGIAALLFMALSFSIFNEKLNTIDLEEAQNTKPIEQSQSGDQAISGNSIINPTNVKGIISKDPSENISQATNTLEALIAEDLLSEEASNFISENSTSSDDENLELNLDNKEFSILDLLIKKGFDAFGNSIVLNRKKLSYETPENLLADNSNFLQRSWFGLISGISPFDPNFKINNFERAALVGNNNFPRSSFEFNSLGDTGTDPLKSQTFAFPLSQPYNDVKAGNSINVGFNYGRRIKRNFSIESGIRYMAGKSLIATNVYSYNHRTGNVSTFLESNYLSKGTTVFDNTVISSGGDIDNDYTFLMVPLQLGYHVPLTDKLEAAFLAGISGDIIINNVFDNISEGGSKLTSANSAYKTINLSGMGGMKVNYLVRENWQLSIGTNVQQTLTSGIEKTEGFSFKPRYLGLNYGVNYRFN